jgi:hypothetical protein
MEDVTTARSALAWFHAHAWMRWPLALGSMALWWTALVHPGLWYELLGSLWWLARWGLVVPSALFLALLTERHRSLLVGMLLASPAVLVPAYFVADAVVEYSEGEAVILRGGMPSVVYDVHPTLRIPMRFTGCMVSEMSELEEAINNGTLELLVEWFGPMPGTSTDG